MRNTIGNPRSDGRRKRRTKRGHREIAPGRRPRQGQLVPLAQPGRGWHDRRRQQTDFWPARRLTPAGPVGWDRCGPATVSNWPCGRGPRRRRQRPATAGGFPRRCRPWECPAGPAPKCVCHHMPWQRHPAAAAETQDSKVVTAPECLCHLPRPGRRQRPGPAPTAAGAVSKRVEGGIFSENGPKAHCNLAGQPLNC
jgi:hypothetical protein